jgi:enamine deaminase RidA (YjgF/YER057c/UK114 family)
MTTEITRSSEMQRRAIHPWTWQDAFGYVQANEISGARRVLLCAGQLATDANSHLLHAGDMRGQIGQSLDNLETVLQAAGLGLGDVVRLNFYTTNVDSLMEAMAEFGDRLATAWLPAGNHAVGRLAPALPRPAHGVGGHSCG